MDIVQLPSTKRVLKQIEEMIYNYMGMVIGNDAAEFIDNVKPSEDIEYWGIFDGDKLVAFCGLGSRVFDHSVNLGFLAVDKNHRRLGMATSLIHKVEKEAIKRGYQYMFIETYSGEPFKNARRLYRKLGYCYAGYIKGLLTPDTNSIYFRKKIYKKKLRKNNGN